MDALGKLFSLSDVRFGGFAPHHIAIGCKGQASLDGIFRSSINMENTFTALAPFHIGMLIGSESDCMRFADTASVRPINIVGTPSTSAARRAVISFEQRELLAQLSHPYARIFLGRKVGPPVDCGCARLDHCLDQFISIQRASKTGFCVGDDRSKPVDAAVVLHVVDLVGPCQGVVNALDEGGEHSLQDKGLGPDRFAGHRLHRLTCHPLT